MPEHSAEQLIRRYHNLKSNRIQFETLWDMMAFFCQPYKQNFLSSRMPGQDLPTDKYDDIGSEINLLFAAGLSAYMTNQSTEWFYLEPDDPRLRNNRTASIFLQEVKEEAYYILNHSNFYSQVHENYLEFNPYGNACLYSKDDPKDVVRFYAKSIANVLFCEDSRNDLNTIFDVWKMTASQADEKFKGKAGETVRSLLEAQKPDDYVTFINVVIPRNIRENGKIDAKNKPFASYWIEESKKEIIEESGYDEFPFSIVRGSVVPGEVYGWSPLMMQKANLKTQNKIQESVVIGVQRTVAPALIIPNDEYITPFTRRADAVNIRHYNELEDKRGVEVIPSGNPAFGIEYAEKKKEDIRKATFVDVFLMLAQQTGNKTATEVIEQTNEKKAMLSFLTNNFFPYHSKNIEQIINIAFQQGRMPKIPPELAGMQYTIKYSSPLARAQKLSESRSYQDYLAFISSLGQIKPEILDLINVDKIGRVIGRMYNIPAEFLFEDDEVMQIRTLRAQKIEEQEELAKIGAGAQIAKTGSEADRNMRTMTKTA